MTAQRKHKPDYRQLSEKFQEQVFSLEKYLHRLSILRQIENLNENNFQVFLGKNHKEVLQEGSNFYFPCSVGITLSGAGVGKFARQC